MTCCLYSVKEKWICVLSVLPLIRQNGQKVVNPCSLNRGFRHYHSSKSPDLNRKHTHSFIFRMDWDQWNTIRRTRCIHHKSMELPAGVLCCLFEKIWPRLICCYKTQSGEPTPPHATDLQWGSGTVQTFQRMLDVIQNIYGDTNPCTCTIISNATNVHFYKP